LVASTKDVAIVIGVIGIIIAVIVAGRQAFGAISGIKLPEIKLPEFPTFEFPTIEFPEFPTFEFPEFPTFEFPDFTNLFTGFQQQQQDFLGNLQEQFNNLFQQGGGNGADMEQDGGPDEFFETGQGGARSERGDEMLPDIPLRDITDEPTDLTPAQRFAFIERGVIPTGFEVVNGVLVAEQEQVMQLENLIVQSEIPGQQFGGGGVSFIGGQVTETPLEFLTLNQIIEMGLASSASEARSLQLESTGFQDTGGTFFPESFFTQQSQGLPEGLEAPLFGGFTGDPQFQGLTPEEIFRRLVGGIITNF